ncbi:MAG: hypothetical protein DBY08_03210 [Clostridiales bacterium]|nr:hypothetical protein [Bacillota bacterium]PWL94196.1 MAG: hypothetical protein DBY08_03210 [Clostridiales bacterium]
MKEIKLVPDMPFHNYVEIAVMDFPDGKEGHARQRCKVKAEFAEYDVLRLKERGLRFNQAIEEYEKWLYEVIRFHLAQDWKCIGGYEAVMHIIREKVSAYY